MPRAPAVRAIASQTDAQFGEAKIAEQQTLLRDRKLAVKIVMSWWDAVLFAVLTIGNMSTFLALLPWARQ